MVSLSNHERTALRQAQGQRDSVYNQRTLQPIAQFTLGNARIATHFDCLKQSSASAAPLRYGRMAAG